MKKAIRSKCPIFFSTFFEPEICKKPHFYFNFFKMLQKRSTFFHIFHKCYHFISISRKNWLFFQLRSSKLPNFFQYLQYFVEKAENPEFFSTFFQNLKRSNAPYFFQLFKISTWIAPRWWGDFLKKSDFWGLVGRFFEKIDFLGVGGEIF